MRGARGLGLSLDVIGVGKYFAGECIDSGVAAQNKTEGRPGKCRIGLRCVIEPGGKFDHVARKLRNDG